MAKGKNKPAVPPRPAATQTPVAGKRSIPLHMRLCLALAALAMMVYANTLRNAFALDDSMLLFNNKFVKEGLKAVPKLLVTPHQLGFWVNPNDEYRPLALVTNAVIYEFAELNPAPYHAFNILVFGGCIALLFVFLWELFDRKRIALAFIATLLFALHPIHTDVVANIKSCDELLSFLLAMGGLVFSVRYVRSGRILQLVSATACFFLAHLAKETVFTLIVVVPVVFFFYIDHDRRRSLHVSSGFAAAAALFLATRYAVLAHWHVRNLPHISLIENALQLPGLSASSRIATAILMMGMYVKLLFVPWPLLSDYSYSAIPYVTFSDWRVLLTIAIYAGLAVFAAIRFFRSRRDPYAFAIFFYFVTIALFSNLLVSIKATMAERFLFYPSLGLCIAAAAMLVRNREDKGIEGVLQPRPLWILLPLCIVYTGITVTRNGDWQNNEILYTTDANKAPDNARINYLAGDELFTRYKTEEDPVRRQQLLSDAIKYYSRAAHLYPGYAVAVADLGAAFFMNKQYDSAEYYDRAEIRLEPRVAVSRNNLSGVYINSQQFRKAANLGRETIEMVPDDVNVYADLGIAYRMMHQYDSAIYFLDLGIARYPKFFGTYMVKSQVYDDLGRPDSALHYRNAGSALVQQQAK